MARMLALSLALVIGTWMVLAILPPVPQVLRSTLFAGWVLGAIGVLTLPYLVLGRLSRMASSESTADSSRKAILVTLLGSVVAVPVIKAIASGAHVDEIYGSLASIANFGLLYLLRRRLRSTAESNVAT